MKHESCMKMSQTRACCNHGCGRWRLTRGAHDLNMTMLDPLQHAKPCQALQIMCADCVKRHIRLSHNAAALSTPSCPTRRIDGRDLKNDGVDNDTGHPAHERCDNGSRGSAQDTMFSDSPWRCTIGTAVALPGTSNRSISINNRWIWASKPLVLSPRMRIAQLREASYPAMGGSRRAPPS